MPPAIRAQAREYWSTSRSHRYSLHFALPLLCSTSCSRLVAPVRASGGVVRNGADVLLTGVFTLDARPARATRVHGAGDRGSALADPSRPDGRAVSCEHAGARCSASRSCWRWCSESWSELRRCSWWDRSVRWPPAGAWTVGALARLTLSLGAGLYEELLFRVVIVALLANGSADCSASGRLRRGIAAVVMARSSSRRSTISALWASRCSSRVVRLPCARRRRVQRMYLTRGFGITAWTHALYDVAVLF